MRRVDVLVAVGLLLVASAQIAVAQSPPAPGALDLTLPEALERAASDSEEVRLAAAAVEAATTQITTARSAALPQLAFTSGYVRTFQSPFQSAFSFPTGGGTTFAPDPNVPLEQRVTYLEQNVGRAAIASLGSLFSSGNALPIGRAHAYSFTFNFQQVLYAGGRIGAAVDAAREVRSATVAGESEQRADIQLQVRGAYYRALLAQELETIADAALVQAESFLNQEQLRQKAGFASELDVLRAEVSLENLRPQLVAAQNASQLARLNLQRLVNVPMTTEVRLTTPLEIPRPEELANEALNPDVETRLRATVEATERQSAAQAQNLRLARAARLPSVSLQMGYGGQATPPTVLGFNNVQWQPDWSATFGVQVPLFTGFETQASIARAEVTLRQSQLQLAQVREAVVLESQQALGEKSRARASIGARQRTVDQAQRVYDLTVLRYQQGQSTELEVSQSRLELRQARSNLAQSIADFYLADAGQTGATVAAGISDTGSAATTSPASASPTTGSTMLPQSTTTRRTGGIQ